MYSRLHEVERVNDIEQFTSSLKWDELETVLKPISLYHYTSAEGLMNIIENKELWLSNSDFLNDKQEIRYTMDMLLSIIDELMGNEPTTEAKVFKELMKKSIEKKDFMFDVYTLSLSKNPDSNLLWSNYAKNDGYNIEFSYLHLYLTLNSNIEEKSRIDDAVYSHFVIYNKEIQKELLKKEIINLYKIFLYAFDKKDLQLYYDHRAVPLTNILLYSIFFKDECFSQEEEFRCAVIIYDEQQANTIYNSRISNGVFIPYINLSIQRDNINFPVTSITIGPKNNLDIAEEGLKKFLMKQNLQEVEIKKSKIPYRY